MGRRLRPQAWRALCIAVLVIVSVVYAVPATVPAHVSEELPSSAADPVWPSPSPSSSDDFETASPSYPSSGIPQPWGRTGPDPLLANVIANHGFDVAWGLGYRGTGVRVAVVDEGVDFGHLDLQGTQAVVTDPASPYFGWPIAYDPSSLTTYLETSFTDGTLYANTTRTGLGPFEVTHTVVVDGTNDFGDRERWAADPRDNTAGGPGGDKADFDLTDVFVTRDADNWYFGFPMYLRDRNASFVMFIDVDNETAGAYTAPAGLRVDTNTSHADRVNDVRWSPDGTKLATAAGDRLVRIWDRQGRILFTLSGHAVEPMSLAWSPSGAVLASADNTWIRLWNASTGALIREIQYRPFVDVPINENRVLAFSPNGTWIVASTFKFVHVFNAASGVRFGTVWPANTEINALSFRPGAGDQLAVGLGDNTIRVYAMVPGTFNTAVPATPLFTLAGHTQPVLEVAWSPDGTKLVSGARDDTARLWDIGTQSLIRTLPNHQSWVFAASWAPSSAQFVTSSRGLEPTISPSFAIWDSAGNLIRLVNRPRAVFAVSWSSLGELATGANDQTARMWTSAGDMIRIFVAQRPDYALFVHGFSRYSDRENKYVHGAELAVWYTWNETAGQWDPAPLLNVSGRQAAFQFGEALFNEFSVPRSLIRDLPAIGVTLFSAGDNGTKAQDTVPSDRGVDFRGLDFSPGWSSLSAWSWRQIQEYRVSGLTSASNAFHFGFHPAPTVQRQFGALGVLVVDNQTAGFYERVVLDMNDDKVFDATDVTLTRANPIAAIDTYNATAGAPGRDGYPDVSAGMVYFIADGVNPIPYSDRLAARKAAQGLTVRVPGAGDLVAFAGEFGVDPITAVRSEHGTRMASAIVAQGRLPNPLTGTANGAKLVTVVNGLSDVIEAWNFAIEGYDGLPGTGDEAHVVVSPFNFPTLHTDGWDVYSRTADFLSTQRSLTAERVRGGAIFVASAGDYGFGYGTVASPASGSSVIAAGRAADFTLRSSVSGGSEGPNPQVRNPAVPGSRGPSAHGFVKPELLAADTTTLAIPLHSSAEGSSAVSSSPMVGSDVSAAVVAGAAAIVIEAFNATRGRDPTTAEVRAILMSGADDAGHDVLTQGAGYLNVARSVKLAAGTADAGLEVSPSTWHPGSYRGSVHEGFTRLLFPGTNNSVSVTLRNRGASPIDAALSAVTYTKIGEYVHTNATVNDLYQPNGDIALWVNDTGMWKVDGTTLASVRLAPPVPGVWANAELVKVTAYGDLGRLATKDGTTYRTNYSYMLRAYDWTIEWSHWGGFGPFPAPSFFMDELNTIGETFHQSNVLEVRAAFPAGLNEALVVSLEDVATPTFIPGLTWTFVIEFYDRADWGWVTLTPANATVPANGTATVTARVVVPPTASLGSYESAILVRDTAGGDVTTIPVLANVGARSPSLSFGGGLGTSDLFDNHRLFGGYDKALSSPTRLLRPTLGDWRFFFFEIPDQGQFENPANLRILINTAWPNAPSDVDTFAFGRDPAEDAATQGNSSWYGAFTMRQAEKSEELDKPEFRTVTGGPEEVITYALRSGLNVIALRAFALRGMEIDVRIAGQAGWLSTPTSLDVATQNLAGRAPFSFLSNMDLPALRASAVGPAQTTSFTDLPVAQDVQSWWNFAQWGEWMMRGTFDYIFSLEKALILEVHIVGKADTQDLDLAVFRDTDGDGLVSLEEAQDANQVRRGGNGWEYDADADADEFVKWIAPPDGQYIVKVLGYDVPAGLGHFDMDVAITLDTGKGYEVPEAPKPSEIVNGTGSGLPAFTRVEINISWDFPNDTADGPYGGAILFGLPNAPGVLVVPVVIGIDRAAPRITDFRVNALNGLLNEVDNRTTNDRSPTLAIAVEDPDRGELVAASARVKLNGVDMTPLASVSVQYLTRNNKLGLWEGTIVLPAKDLVDGTYVVNASIADRAGNRVWGEFTFAVDRSAPPLAVAGGPLVYAPGSTYTLTGTTEPNASVKVRGVWYPADASGAFSIGVTLLEGRNELTVTAADWFDMDPSGNPIAGNSVTVTQVVVYDLSPPAFDRFSADPGGVTTAGSAVLLGTLRDPLSPSEAGDPAALTLEVDGQPVPVMTDGTFRLAVTLAEGDNTFTAMARDPAGNEATRTVTVTRDTTAPTLTVEPVASSVTTATILVRGTAETGAIVTVNGLVAAAAGGPFEATVALSPGANTVVVEARDFVGNVAEERLAVTYVAPSAGVSTTTVTGLLFLGILLGALLAFLLIRYNVRVPFLPTRKPSGPEEEAEPEAEPEAEGPEGPAEEEPAEEPAEEEPPAEDERAARLRKAYEDGRISREVYEENLRKLRGAE